MLPQLKMIVILILGLTCGGGQQIPPLEGNTLILRNVIDTLDNLSLQLKEFEEKVEAKFEEVQANVTGIIETQKTIQADIKRLQQCSTEVQLSQFQELVFKDDCVEGSHTCGDMSTCTDYFNRYECSCLPGYSGDGITCQDVDECSLNTDDCSEEMICINNPGSYECKKCPRFFKNEGDICQGPVCESSPTSHFIPEIGCLTLVSEERMTWDESKSKCQEMGLRLAEGIQRRHFQALSDHFYPLVQWYGAWIGFRHRQWLNQEEEEEIQEKEWHEGQPDGDLEECGYISLSPSYLGLGDDQCSWSFYPLCQSLP